MRLNDALLQYCKTLVTVLQREQFARVRCGLAGGNLGDAQYDRES